MENQLLGLNEVGVAGFELPACNVLLIGSSGVGKSSLINALLGTNSAPEGTGKPVTKRFDEYRSGKMLLLDSKGFELESKNACEIEKIVAEIDRRAPLPNDAIHLIWFCFEATTPRDQELHRECIDALCQTRAPVIAVVTQSIEPERYEKLASALKADCPGLASVLPVAAKEIPLGAFAHPSHGLPELLDASSEVFESAGRKMAFINAQRASLPLQEREARRLLGKWLNETPLIKQLAVAWQHQISTGSIEPVKGPISSALEQLSVPLGASIELRTHMTTFLQRSATSPANRLNVAGTDAITLSDWERLARKHCRALGSNYLAITSHLTRRQFDGEILTPKQIEEVINDAFN